MRATFRIEPFFALYHVTARGIVAKGCSTRARGSKKAVSFLSVIRQVRDSYPCLLSDEQLPATGNTTHKSAIF